MKLSEITLDVVKSYLRIDHNLDDMRLELHRKATLNYILKANGQDTLTEEFDNNEFLADVYMSIIQHYYDTGEPPKSQYLNAILTMDRRFEE